MGACTSLPCGKEIGKVQELILQCQNMITEGEHYDYHENKQIAKSKLRITGSGYIAKLGRKVLFFRKSRLQSIPKEAHIMLEVTFEDGNVALNYAPGLEDSDFLDSNVTFKKVPWLVAGPFTSESYGYKLKEEDVVRFGRVQFIIKRLNAKGCAVTEEEEEGGVRTNRRSRSMRKRLGTMTWETSLLANRILTTPSSHPQNGDQSGTNVGRTTGDFSMAYKENIKTFGQFTPQYAAGNLDFGSATEPQNEVDTQERSCRICLCEEDDADDPIVRPCRCQGTMRDVHVKCFKKWLTKHVVTKNSRNMCSVIWQQLKCELCGYEVENFLEANSKRYELIEFPKLPQPHVALEYYVGGKSKGFHFLKFVDGKSVLTFVTLILLLLILIQCIQGKATESDLRVNDNTVSKYHAAISLHDGEFYIKDLDSKYGTSILVDEPEKLFISRGQDLTLQVDRSTIKCHVDSIVRQIPAKRQRSAKAKAVSIDANSKQKTKEGMSDNIAVKREMSKDLFLVAKKVNVDADVDSPSLPQKAAEAGSQKPLNMSTEAMSSNESLNNLGLTARIETQDTQRSRMSLTIKAAAAHSLYGTHGHIRESSREYMDSPQKSKRIINEEPQDSSTNVQRFILPTNIERIDSLNKGESQNLSSNRSLESEESKSREHSVHDEANDSRSCNEDLKKSESFRASGISQNSHQANIIQRIKLQQKIQSKGDAQLKQPSSFRVIDQNEKENEDCSRININRRQSQPDICIPKRSSQQHASQFSKTLRRGNVNTAIEVQDEPYFQKCIENDDQEVVRLHRSEKLMSFRKNLEIYTNKSEKNHRILRMSSLTSSSDPQKGDKSDSQIISRQTERIEKLRTKGGAERFQRLQKSTKQAVQQEEEDSIDVPNCNEEYSTRFFQSNNSQSLSRENTNRIEDEQSQPHQGIPSAILSLGDVMKDTGINLDIEA